MKKSICIETIFTEYPFSKRFKLANGAGFEYVEFWTWSDKNLKDIKDLAKENNLKIASFSGDEEFSMIDKSTNEKYIEFLENSIEKAKYLECENLVIHSNALGKGGVVLNRYEELGELEKFINMYKVLAKSAPLAEKANVKLVLEPLNTKVDHPGNCLTFTKDAAELVKMVDSPYIKILYDVYHMQIMEGNIINTIEENFEVIDYIHIADNPGRHEPGTGEINYNNVFKKLRDLNYQGFVGFELFPTTDSKEVAYELGKL